MASDIESVLSEECLNKEHDECVSEICECKCHDEDNESA
jgi:hypothetical protein